MTNLALTAVSSNAKLGPIPASTSARETCPTTCPFYTSGCYAKAGRTAIHWRKVTQGERGTDLSGFLAKVRRIAAGALWRHNVSGDLLHTDGIIDRQALRSLTAANRGRRGFTYTHHKLSGANLEAIQEANAAGFTVNASTESVEVADKIMSDFKIPAVTVVSSTESRRFFRTESGRQVIVCPATIHKGVTCSTCGICQQSDREAIVAFPAHGTAKRKVDAILVS